MRRRFLRKGFFGRGCGKGRGRGRGRGNSPKVCTCPECGYTESSERGIPCTEKKCPKCDTVMKGELCL
ncbi:hypothetical protein K8R20_02795 [bacterium]|nr:hypothetical protein [bacterium]